MKLRLALIPALSALAVLALVTALHPPSDDFHPSNPHWNGLERLASEFSAAGVRIRDAHALNPLDFALLIVGPSQPLEPEDARAVGAFLARGGRVVVADDYGTANQLLEGLNVSVRIVQGVVVDPLLNLGSPQLPLAWWGATRIALNYAAALNTSACLGCRTLVETSPFSYLDLNLNGRHDEGEPEGPLPIAVLLRFGAGELIVVSDSSLFINSMLDRESNAVLLREMLEGRRPAIVIDRWDMTSFATIKGWLVAAYQLLRSPEIRYAIAAAVLVLSVREGYRMMSGRR